MRRLIGNPKHGPNLRGSLKGVTVVQAAWRPSPGRHNIWELMLHCAYWKYKVRRRLTGEEPGTFVLKGSNFFARPGDEGLPEGAWKKDLAILFDEHQKLKNALAGIVKKNPDERALHMIRGIAAHDLYHAGQIRMLLRMQG